MSNHVGVSGLGRLCFGLRGPRCLGRHFPVPTAVFGFWENLRFWELMETWKLAYICNKIAKQTCWFQDRWWVRLMLRLTMDHIHVHHVLQLFLNSSGYSLAVARTESKIMHITKASRFCSNFLGPSSRILYRLYMFHSVFIFFIIDLWNVNIYPPFWWVLKAPEYSRLSSATRKELTLTVSWTNCPWETRERYRCGWRMFKYASGVGVCYISLWCVSAAE